MFSSEVGFLCPKNVLKSVVGFCLESEPETFFPAEPRACSELAPSLLRACSELAPDCDHIHPLIHLGGRYFLSTASGTLTLSRGELDVSPFAVYNFPCNVSFIGMKTSLGNCPQRLTGITSTVFNCDYICSVGSHPTGLASGISDHPTAY